MCTENKHFLPRYLFILTVSLTIYFWLLSFISQFTAFVFITIKFLSRPVAYIVFQVAYIVYCIEIIVYYNILWWFGHVLRSQPNSVTKTAFQFEPGGHRSWGRPWTDGSITLKKTCEVWTWILGTQATHWGAENVAKYRTPSDGFVRKREEQSSYIFRSNIN